MNFEQLTKFSFNIFGEELEELAVKRPTITQ